MPECCGPVRTLAVAISRGSRSGGSVLPGQTGAWRARRNGRPMPCCLVWSLARNNRPPLTWLKVARVRRPQTQSRCRFRMKKVLPQGRCFAGRLAVASSSSSRNRRAPASMGAVVRAAEDAQVMSARGSRAMATSSSSATRTATFRLTPNCGNCKELAESLSDGKAQRAPEDSNADGVDVRFAPEADTEQRKPRPARPCQSQPSSSVREDEVEANGAARSAGDAGVPDGFAVALAAMRRMDDVEAEEGEVVARLDHRNAADAHRA